MQVKIHEAMPAGLRLRPERSVGRSGGAILRGLGALEKQSGSWSLAKRRRTAHSWHRRSGNGVPVRLDCLGPCDGSHSSKGQYGRWDNRGALGVGALGGVLPKVSSRSG